MDSQNVVVESIDITDVGEVCDEDACPACGENRVDYLVWDEYFEAVRCATCGAVYEPKF